MSTVPVPDVQKLLANATGLLSMQFCCLSAKPTAKAAADQAPARNLGQVLPNTSPNHYFVFLNSHYLPNEDVALDEASLSLDVVSARIWTVSMFNKIHVGYLIKATAGTSFHPYALFMRRGEGPLLPDRGTRCVYQDEWLCVTSSPRNMTATVVANIPMTLKGITSWRKE